jgi:hypothetical protein
MAVKVKKVKRTDDPTYTDPGSGNKYKIKERVYNKGEGLGGVLGEVGNFLGDAYIGASNGTDSIVKWLLSKPQSAPGAGYGEMVVGGQLPKKGSLPTGHNYTPTSTPAREDEKHRKTFAEYLAEANAMYGGVGTDWEALKNGVRSEGALGDARLQAMYTQLRNSIDADEGGIRQNYDKGTAEVGAHAGEAAANVTEAYQAARDAQTQQLSALGIGDAAAVLAGQGGAAAADQAHAVGNIAQNQTTNQNQLAQHKTSAVDYNTNIGNAAGLAGDSRRAALQGNIQKQIAQLILAQGQEKSQQMGGKIDLAKTLYSMDPDNAAGMSAADQQNLAEFMYQQQRDTLEDQQGAQGQQTKVYMQLVDKYDGDLEAASKAFAQMQAAGLV